MAFAEDLTAFFNPDEFGTKALLDWVQVVGIFSNEPVQAFDAIATSTPTFVLPTAACANTTLRSELQVNTEIAAYRMQDGSQISAASGASTRYRVCGIEHSGTGTTKLRLELIA